jgi:hypothetical protein
MELKNFVDFAYSLKNMDEVRDGVFIVPKELVFELDENTHDKIEGEVLQQKGLTRSEKSDEFRVSILGVNFKFIKVDGSQRNQ